MQPTVKASFSRIHAISRWIKKGGSATRARPIRAHASFATIMDPISRTSAA
jgi:hypothetical protein